jgi:integrase
MSTVIFFLLLSRATWLATSRRPPSRPTAATSPCGSATAITTRSTRLTPWCVPISSATPASSSTMAGLRPPSPAGWPHWSVSTVVRRRAADRPHCPALNLRRPRRPSESPRPGLSRTELADWLDAGEQVSGHLYALACLLALNGLRVGEVCAADVIDLAQDRWHHTLTILGNGDKPAVVPLPPRTVDAVRSAVGDRQAGPLLLTRTGARMTRGAAARIVTRLAVQAGKGI